ncbi:MAG TPA: sugar transferase [Deltaproteobacteria bacterium]|nr:sugar transferase [Deltaproteobacteria bacterium]
MPAAGIRQNNLNRFVILAGDILLILLATQIASWLRFGTSYSIFITNTGASFFTMLLYMTMLYIFDLYHRNYSTPSAKNAIRTAVAVGSAGIVLVILFYSLPHWEYGRGIFLIQIILVWCFVFGWRALFFSVFPTKPFKEEILILGAGSSGKTIMELLENPNSPYQAVGFLDDDPQKEGTGIASLPVIGSIDKLQQIAEAKGIKTAILAITQERSKQLIRKILNARLNGLVVLDMPSVFEDLTGAVPVEHIRDDWLVFADGFNLISKQYVQRTKRLFDVVISALLFLVTSPVFAITALAIKLGSSGPVFFGQTRVGKGGKNFVLWKFRSMKKDAEKDGAAWAKKKDPRITAVGRIIRVLRIDELPQIFSVFRGDMSLIGPRPERPEFVQGLEIEIPYYGLRHSVRPGITGWAQVNYSYGASVEDSLRKLEFDIFYIKNMSLILDAKIALKTIGVVLFGQGAR